MKRIIAIVCGGDSSEHDVSLRSAQGVYSFIDPKKYERYIIELSHTKWEAHTSDGRTAPIDRNDFSFQDGERRIKPDFAYIIIHGTPGENGILQGYFDLIQMPYSTSGVFIESLTFNKFALNQYLKEFGVRIAESMLLRKKNIQEVSDEAIADKIGFPCFVKPNAGGSSFGVTKVKEIGQLRHAIDKALLESDEVMVETYMNGTEITCGCYRSSKGIVVFPITEVVTSNEFFDYNAKYNGQVREITPARIAENTAQRVSKLTSSIYELLGCDGIIRIDYILTGEKDQEQINMLEINTTPGMTATSFIPQQIRAAGLDISDVMSDIIEQKFTNI